MKIYTKTGDTGETSLYGGKRVNKDDLLVEAYGTVDECNAVIGIAITYVSDNELKQSLQQIQSSLLELGADLATPLDHPSPAFRISGDNIRILESEIDRYEIKLEPLRNFILPGGAQAGANLHLARTICRRAERIMTTLAHGHKINVTTIPYINRLSDLLFVLARAANVSDGVSEHIWER